MTPTLATGGAERQIAELAPRLAARGWEVTVVSAAGPGPIGTALVAGGVRVIHATNGPPLRGVSSPAALFRLATRTAAAVRSTRPDIVHAHMVPANLMMRLTRPWLGTRALVCTSHSVFEGARWRTWGYRLTDRLCDVTTSISNASLRQMVDDGRAPSNRAVLIPNGVDTARFRHRPDHREALRAELALRERFTWLAVGRLVDEKDWPVMLRAFALAPAARKSILLLVGDGPLRTELHGLAERLNLSGERVRFLGARHDVEGLMSAADAFILSSKIEGLPMVLLEAASCSLPIVATDVGGVAEIVECGRTGLLVRARDPHGLASAVSELEATSPARRALMGRLGRASTQRRYGIASVVEQWDRLYHTLLRQSRRRVHLGGQQ